MAKTTLDYSKLREKQLAHAEWNGDILDGNPEGYVGRTYDELRKIKYPLILDFQIIRKEQVTEGGKVRTRNILGPTSPPRVPWTVEEVISAMVPAIKALGQEYGGKRPGYTRDDAEAEGYKAILDALWTDKGLAWFAGHCYERVEAAIKRGSKTSGLIRAPEYLKQWRDNVRYTEDAVGEGEGTLGEFIGSSLSLPLRRACGDYDVDGNLIRKTCNKGMVGDQKCDRCGGTGLIMIPQTRVIQDPQERVSNRERVQEAKAVWAELRKSLTPKQIEVMELRYGMDPVLDTKSVGVVRDPTEVAKILVERHGMGGKNRVQQVLDAVSRKLREIQASNRLLTEQIDQVLDEEVEKEKEPIPVRAELLKHAMDVIIRKLKKSDKK